MKSLKGIMSIFLLLTIFSCVTTENNTDKMDLGDSEQTSADKGMVEKEIEEIVYFVAKEQAFYGDGQIDTIATYTYNDNFDLVSRILTNEQSEVLESFFDTVKDGKVVRRDNFGFGNVLNNYFIYEYDMDTLIYETMYDKEDKIQSINKYEYTNNLLSSWSTLDPNGGTLAITEYEYDKNQNNTIVKIKDALGAVDGIIEKSYKNNLITEELVKDSKGSLEKSTQYVYDGEVLVEKVFFDKRGKKKRSETYEFDSSLPVPDRMNILYTSGDLEAYTLYEYESKVVTSTVLVEE